ncbi:MAG: anthranilate synthase component I [Acidimicrobiia bacterium]
MLIHPGREEFIALAKSYPLVPVWTKVLADRETPVSAFEKLVGAGPGFLLESVEGGENWARWSFIGWDPLFTLTSYEGRIESQQPLQSDDPLGALEELVARVRAADLPGLPPLHSGLVGYLGYDTVRYIEHLPDRPADDRSLPEMSWQAVGSLAAFDRVSQSLTLVRNVLVGNDLEADYAAAVNALERAATRLGHSRPYRALSFDQRPAPGGGHSSTMTRTDFENAVRSAKRSILAGDAFQVVISQRLAVPFAGDPFVVYRWLRVVNPSPYLFFYRTPELAVAGSSPELMTRVRDRQVFSRPIAGTRPRGETPDLDRALEEELRADPKERAEHVMLLDLARNDLGRVCEFGTVSVDELMVVERYSHVMHLVSGVSGKLRVDVGPVDVLRATFPHGTVSGAPKVAAMEIIDRLEPVARGPYAGAVGYIDFSGNVDTAICLRTVVLAGGQAWVQAGAGIVADSEPAMEYEETMSKAAAALAAVEAATHE